MLITARFLLTATAATLVCIGCGDGRAREEAHAPSSVEPVMADSSSQVLSPSGGSEAAVESADVPAEPLATAEPLMVSGEQRLRTVWRVGAIEGSDHELFGRISVVSAGPHGGVYALDYMNSTVSVFDPEGRFLRSFGRPGRGPGDLGGPLSMVWDGDGQLWIAEFGAARYSVFDSLGTFVRSVPRPVYGAARWQQDLIFDSTGHLIEESALVIDGRTVVAHIRMDTAGTVTDTFPHLNHGTWFDVGEDFIARHRRRLGQLRPYATRLVYTLAPDGSIWFGYSNDFRVYRRSLSGDTIAVIVGAHRQPRMTRSEQAEFERLLAPVQRELASSGLGKQVMQAIRVLPDGSVMVQIEEGVGVPSALHDVFDPHGVFVGSVRTEIPLATDVISTARGDTLFTAGVDSFGVNHLMRIMLPERSRIRH